MAMGNLQGISTEITEDTVNRVASLLNSGQVTVGEVSQYFDVPKDVIMQSLTGVSAQQFANNSYTAEDADKLERLVRTGVASTGEVASFAGTTPDVIERHLSDIRGYNAADIANAQAGQGNISAPVVNTAALPPTSISMPAGATADINPAFVNADGTGIGPMPAPTPTPTPTTPLAGNTAATPAATPTANPLSNVPPQFATQTYATGSEIPTGLRGSEMALKGGTIGAIEMLDQLNRAGRTDLVDQYTKGLEQAATQAGTASGFMQPYQQAGETALQQQLALSGALGQDAFNQAYQESPQMAFLREQGMRANLAGASATGGLGGGNVQRELQRFGQGLASQGLQQQIGNLAGLSGQGQNAAGTMANIATNLGGQQLQTQANLGNQLAAYNLSTGLPAAQSMSNLGTNLAAGRTRAGELLAQQYGQTATNLGNVYSGQGRDVANMLGGQRDLIMNQVNQQAINEAKAQQQFGADMAGIQGGIASNIAGVPQAQMNVPDYQGAVSGALTSAQLGYDLFNQPQTTQAPTNTYTGNLSGGWGGFVSNPANFNPYQQVLAPTVGMPNISSTFA